MENKLCMVTGANSGIGKSTAMALAKQGAYVVMVCRNEERAEKARKDIIDSTGNTGVEVMLADFAYQYEIRELADHFNSKFEELDVLINNAGMIASKREETIDGIEKTLAVNHLGSFLLTNLLLDTLISADSARIVNVSSEVHRLGASVFDLDDLQLEQDFTPIKAYGVSKLCNIMFTRELARRLKDTPVTANALHPGVVSTQLAEEAGWLMKLFYLIGTPFMRSPSKGAETPVYLASSDEVEGISGKYFKSKKQVKPAAIALREDLNRKLWEKSEELTGLKNK
ncbi:MAG: SDR family oxidoreductase [Balneolaceae bacterium]|nr:SDR family oxidoreductase [Balneolaceae bacterium]